MKKPPPLTSLLCANLLVAAVFVARRAAPVPPAPAPLAVPAPELPPPPLRVQPQSGGASGSCDDDFGGGYLSRWRQGRAELCGRGGGRGGGASSVECWAQPGGPLVACLSSNLIASPSSAALPPAPGARRPPPRAGLSCGGGGLRELPAASRPGLRAWLGGAAAAGGLDAGAVRRLCGSARAVRTPVLVVQRYDTINTYHAFE